MIGVAMIASAIDAGEAREMPERHDAQLIDEQADDDRGRAQQNVVDEANDRGEAGVAAVFGEIGAGENAERRSDDQPDHGDDQAADDRIQQAADDAGRRRHLGEDVDRKAADALPEQGRQDDARASSGRKRSPRRRGPSR